MHLSVNAGPIKDREGQVIAAVSVFYDETERRQIEQRVLESQRFLRVRSMRSPAISRSSMNMDVSLK